MALEACIGLTLVLKKKTNKFTLLQEKNINSDHPLRIGLTLEIKVWETGFLSIASHPGGLF